MGTSTDWRPLFVASAASMLRVKASKKWPGWQDAIQEDAAKAACRQAAADIEGIPALRARAEAAEQRAEALAAELAQARAEVARLRAAMESCELDREAHDLFEQADAAEEYGTPRGREMASRLREAAEAAEAKAVSVVRRGGAQ